MSIDTPGTVIIAGWYPDPSDGSQARWWDGTQWTQNTRQRETESPPAEPVQPNRYFSPVAVRTDVTLPPVDPYRPLQRRHDSQGFVSMGVKQTVHLQPTRAYTGSVWAIATVPIWSTVVLLALALALGDFFTPFLILLTSLVLYIISIAYAIHDHKVLLNSMHPKAASHWWMISGPFVYLIVRGVHVSRAVGHGWAPLIVFLICSLVPTATVLALGSLFTLFATLLG